MANIKPTTVTTGEVRISYEHLLKPHANSNLPNAELKYSATLLIPKSDIATKQRIDAAIQAAIQEGITTKWGGVKPPQIPIPIHDGDGVRQSGEPYGPECKGHWVMTASSKQQPEIVDLNLQPIINATEIYSGMYARVCVNFFAYANAGKKGIGCGLGPVQKTRDGEPLAGGISAAEAFSGQGGFAPPAQTAPGYSQSAYPKQPTPPWYTPAYPAAPPAAPAQPQQPPVPSPGTSAQPAGLNPITGQPYAQAAGGVMGL
ncbi:MAG: DUF2815 family protein [Christensenellaceae bacterium]|nr:DUF2815 family protein [Christensenellaceae bacterium]